MTSEELARTGVHSIKGPMTLEQVIEFEAYNMMQCSATEDAREVLRAMRDGREPKYRGY